MNEHESRCAEFDKHLSPETELSAADMSAASTAGLRETPASQSGGAGTVDAALRWSETRSSRHPWPILRILAAEVRRLREVIASRDEDGREV